MQRHFDCWLLGYDAYAEGKDWTHNPYFRENADQAGAWHFGWEAGLEDEEHRHSMERQNLAEGA